MIGLPRTGHDEFVAAIRAVRTLLEGGTTRFNGVDAALTGAVGPCPLYIGAQGPRNLRFAGAETDGIIITMALAPGLLEAKLKPLREGAVAAGRNLDALDIVVWAPAHVTEEFGADLKRFKPTVATCLRNQPADELAAAGIDERDRLKGPVPAGFEPDGTHVADWDVAIAACDEIVSDEIARRWVESFAVVGSAASLPEKLERIARRGVTTLVLTPLASDSNQSLPLGLMQDVSAALRLAP